MKVTVDDLKPEDVRTQHSKCRGCDAKIGTPHFDNCDLSPIPEINSKQIGGNHYKGEGEQHWDMMWRLYGESWFVGNITKYVLRYKKKNGLQDLEKAKHYLDKLIELETSNES